MATVIPATYALTFLTFCFTAIMLYWVGTS